jgi:epoxyqueuosine reductase
VNRHDLAALLKSWALEAGFDMAGIASLETSAHGESFRRWIDRGDHAGMDYMARRVELRLNPADVLAGAKSALCVGLRYWPLGGEPEPEGDLWPRVARYARGRDYHDAMGERLAALSLRIESEFPGTASRWYVDTGPVLERELAARAGLGAVGKNTMLLHPQAGSWFLLGEIFLTLDLAPDIPFADLCGSCTRCLEACPTGALREPYRLDSERCLSYWTIEHRGDFPSAAQEMVGEGGWVFGCDVCQEACPWNGAPEPAGRPEFQTPFERRGLTLADLVTLSTERYQALFRGSPMKRAKLAGLQRNAALAGGAAGG